MRVTIPCPACERTRSFFITSPSMLARVQESRCRSCAHRKDRHTAALELLEEIRWINDGPEQTARRLGTTVTAIARRLHRCGMHAEARPFDRADWAMR